MSHPMHTVPGKFYLITRNGEAFPLAGTLLKYVPDGEDPVFSKYEEDPVQLSTTTLEDAFGHGVIFVEKAEYCEDNCIDEADNESAPQNEECDGPLSSESINDDHRF